MRVGQSRRRDQNEQAIVKALRQSGLKVWQLSAPGFPDLAVWMPSKARLALLEVKRPGGRLTRPQLDFEGPRYVVESPEAALRLFGIT